MREICERSEHRDMLAWLARFHVGAAYARFALAFPHYLCVRSRTYDSSVHLVAVPYVNSDIESALVHQRQPVKLLPEGRPFGSAMVRVTGKAVRGLLSRGPERGAREHRIARRVANDRPHSFHFDVCSFEE